MNLLGVLENGLFALGQILRFPVMVLLWVCVATALYYLGSCLIEAIARRRDLAGFDLKHWLQQGAALDADEARLARLPSSLRTLLRDIRALQAQGALRHGGLENIVAEYDARVHRSLAGPRSLVRIGPSLGLLGTLIPMGSSLAALASGNMQAMAGQMVVAFTSTIIGLATGTLAYAIAAARQHWVNETIREQRFLAEAVAAELERA
jgi:biopolymer transport protein ExbB/TolQ